ncbi:hypothetical protein Pelo_5161 [Pelomyxa schiedti]|nr:hypothetical protein Pelo_5161 [Pelomyxa schiedti]
MTGRHASSDIVALVRDTWLQTEKENPTALSDGDRAQMWASLEADLKAASPSEGTAAHIEEDGDGLVDDDRQPALSGLHDASAALRDQLVFTRDRAATGGAGHI